MSLKTPKLHVGQMGFRLMNINYLAPVVLERVMIVEIIDPHYIMVISKPNGEPEKLWAFDFIPGDRRSIRKAYHTARVMLDLGFRNAFISPREPLMDVDEVEK